MVFGNDGAMWLLRPLPLLLLVVAGCLGAAGLLGCLREDRPSAPAGAAVPVPAREPAPVSKPAPDRVTGRASAVLAAWDRSRAAAYATGDLATLRGLYVPEATAGRRDVRVLRAYVERGLVVRDLELQRSEVGVLVATDRRLVVELRERLAGATAVAARAEAREATGVSLPRSRARQRVVTLVRSGPGSGSGWQVASVVAVDRSTATRPRSGR